MKGNKLASEIIGRITVFEVDIKSFLRKADKKPENDIAINLIKEKVKKLNTLRNDFIAEIEIKKELKLLKKLILTADYILIEIKNIKCEKKYLNEKTDLIAKIFMIYDKSKQLLKLLNN